MMVALPKQQTEPTDPIAEVKATVRIEDYAQSKMGYALKRKPNGEWWMCCPFHRETTPSFHIRPKEQDFKCFGCGVGGDVIDLEMKSTGETNPRIAAEHILAEYGRHPEPRPLPLPRKPKPIRGALSEAAAAWLQGRGISRRVAERNGVTGQNNAIEFPYVNDGAIVNRQTRTLSAKGFRFETGAAVIPFGLDDCEQASTVVIVEGVLDKLAIEEATGQTAVLAMPSATPSKDCYALACEALAGAQKIIIAVDNDEPGHKLRDELIRRLGADRCWLVDWHLHKDANEVLTDPSIVGAAALTAALAEAQPIPVEGVFTIENSWDAIDRLYAEGLPPGSSTGWPLLDRYYTVRRKQLTVITGTPGSGKALDIMTPILTTDGWRLMEDITVGDWVFGEDGRPVQVIAATEVMYDHECYRMTFSDGSEVVCDADHQWVTRDEKARQSARNAVVSGRVEPRELHPKGTDQSHLRTYPSAKTTREIAATLRTDNAERRVNHSVEVAQPLQFPMAELPIDPYVLGVWLGDGHSYHGSITCADVEIIDELERRGYDCTKHAAKYAWGVAGLKAQLRAAGLLQNKQVPGMYFQAAVSQRLDLLRGLMDTDGYATKHGTCEFTSTNYRLAHAVFDLVAGLGMIPTMAEGRATLNSEDCGAKWDVRFTPKMPVFGLLRKQERCVTGERPRCGYRRIVACEPVFSRPVKCIQVDSASHLYLCGVSLIPTHNSVWADALLMNLAKASWDWTFAICSPEMQPLERHWAHLIALWAGKPFGAGPTPRLDREELRQAREFMRDRFFQVLPEEPTVEAVVDRFLWTHRRHGVGGLLLDPWNELDHSRPSGMTETEYCNQQLRALKRIGWLHDVWVGLIAHPTKMYRDKEGKYPVPTLYDINGSAAFANKADAGIVIWRDKNDETKPVEVHVQKVRYHEIGGLGWVKFRHDRLTGRYWETVQ